MRVNVFATTGVGFHPDEAPFEAREAFDMQATRDLREVARETAREVEEGARRLRRVVPGQVRLWRWRTSRFVRDGIELEQRTSLARLLRRVVPIASLLALTVACSLVSSDGGGGGAGELGLAPAPELSKAKKAQMRRNGAPWAYVLPMDHGLRSDRSGRGDFRAPRFHGEHNGIDLLAPVGTPLYAACEGKAMAGVSRSFGYWVQVICPVPDEYMKAGGPRPWASFFYAHLDEIELPKFEWIDVGRSQIVGSVGKTGNAVGSNVQSHLHLEMIIQKNRRHAMDERHLGNDQSGVPAADYFAESLSKHCLEPNGFEPKSRQLQRARRLDPFVALTCLADYKPNFERPAEPLSSWSVAWDRYYAATRFDVNEGLEDLPVARR